MRHFRNVLQVQVASGSASQRIKDLKLHNELRTPFILKAQTEFRKHTFHV